MKRKGTEARDDRRLWQYGDRRREERNEPSGGGSGSLPYRVAVTWRRKEGDDTGAEELAHRPDEEGSELSGGSPGALSYGETVTDEGRKGRDLYR